MSLLNRLPVRRVLVGSGALLAVAFVAIQLVPYGRDHDNPPVSAEVQWDSPRTRELTVKACYACHSNETHWPWYSNIAPASWLVQNDVDEGREELNFSEWNRTQESDEIGESVVEGEMPPLAYNVRFWDRISNDEKNELIAGLRRTFGTGDATNDDDDDDSDD